MDQGNMKTDDIKQLLQRFYNGQTTLEEEQQLMLFFQDEQVPDELQADRALFQQYLSLKSEKAPLPAALEQRLECRIDAWESNRRTVSSGQHRKWYWISGWAAALILAIGIGFHQTRPHTDVEMRDTCETPEQAYAETRRALKQLAEVMEKSEGQLQKANKANRQIKEVLHSINNLKK